MLSRELMGLVCLAILWVNTLLVVGAALKVAERLRLRRRAMRKDGVVEGVVTGQAPLAVHEIEQVGRMAGKGAARPAILFHDRRFSSRVLGGDVETDVETEPGVLQVAPEADRAEVWLAPACRDAAPTPAEFAAAYARSGKAKGFERTVTSAIRPGDRVWICGQIQGNRVAAPEDQPLLVATIDPLGWLGGRMALLGIFQIGALAAAACISWLALHEPHFGTVSEIGAALGLAFFLLIQPAGTKVRDAARLPCEAFVGGAWIEPAARAVTDRSPADPG